MRFRLQTSATDSLARAGIVETEHGNIATPVFMPVGTRATVRTQTRRQLLELDAPVILGNTYHLMRRPGVERLIALGGMRKLMNWPRAILTDSGGFQAFSLAQQREFSEQGVAFRAHADSPVDLLTPEYSIEIQRAIGSDIMMVLDECVPAHASLQQAQEAMHRTHRWAARCFEARRADSSQALFAIVQGACFEALRRQSAQTLVELADFEGYAIGGLAVGESKSEREDITELVCGYLPKDKPRYLMGVGMPIDLLEAVHRGVDMFDCILPTSLAQQGVAFTQRGKVLLRRSVYALREEPLDVECPCEACSDHGRAYLHHLIKCAEPLGWQLVANHNLHFYTRLMGQIRQHILADTFSSFYQRMRQQLVSGDADHPPGPKAQVRRSKPQRNDRYQFLQTQTHARIAPLQSLDFLAPEIDPNEEANARVQASVHLQEHLQRSVDEDPLVVWHLGLGAAHTAMAVLRQLDQNAQLKMFSFEIDASGLDLALMHHKKFRHLHHAAPSMLQKHRVYSAADVQWRFVASEQCLGDETVQAPDVVFVEASADLGHCRLEDLAWCQELFARCNKGCELIVAGNNDQAVLALSTAGFQVERRSDTHYPMLIATKRLSATSGLKTT